MGLPERLRTYLAVRGTCDRAAPVRVVHVLEATEGGTRRWLEEVVCGLDPARVENACICSLRREASFAETVAAFRRRGIAVWCVDMRREIAPWSDLKAARQIAAILSERPCDIVHAHSSKAGILARWACRRIGHRPVLYTPHAFAFLGGGVFSPLYFQAERVARFWVDRLVAVSESEAEAALHLGYRREQVVAVFNGVAMASRPGRVASGARSIVGTVGNLRPQKDPETFVRCCRLLGKGDDTLGFTILGEGPLRGKVEGLIHESGLKGRFTLPGWMPDARTQIRDWRVFVLSSRFEGLPYSLLDAMAAGVPAVGADVAGIREVIAHERTGLLVPPGNPALLAAAVRRVLDDPALAERLARNAREEVERRFSLVTQLEKLTRLYESLAWTSAKENACAAR